MENEIWKDVVGYEGYYQVSNLGRIRSCEREAICKNKSLRTVKSKILKQHLDNYGYCIISLSLNNKKHTKTIHRLVAEAFIPNLENKPTVNHINETKTDNRVLNLEWATHAEQACHGTRPSRISGENNGNAKPFSYYRNVPTFRGSFKRICRKRNVNFNNFKEIFSCWYVYPNGKRKSKYIYIEKEL